MDISAIGPKELTLRGQVGNTIITLETMYHARIHMTYMYHMKHCLIASALTLCCSTTSSTVPW